MQTNKSFSTSINLKTLEAFIGIKLVTIWTRSSKWTTFSTKWLRMVLGQINFWLVRFFQLVLRISGNASLLIYYPQEKHFVTYLGMWINHNIAALTHLPSVCPTVPRLPVTVAWWTLEFSEAPTLPLIRGQFGWWCGHLLRIQVTESQWKYIEHKALPQSSSFWNL